MGRAATLGLRAGIATATAAAVVTACGGSNGSSISGSTPAPAPATTQGGGATPAAKADIVIKDFAFSPAQFTATVGRPVTVVNDDPVPHTWTADDGAFNSGTLDQGKTFSFTFRKAGTYSYLCSIHPQMKGTVTVR